MTSPRFLRSPDLVLNIPLDLDKQSSADKQGFDRMTVEIFDADLLVPTTLHDTRYAHGVVTVTLVDLHLQSRFRMPSIDADDRQAHLIQLGPQPGRRCSCLKSDSGDMRRMRLDKCCDRLGVRSYHSFALDLSSSIDDADRCQLQRHVQSDIVLHCGSP